MERTGIPKAERLAEVYDWLDHSRAAGRESPICIPGTPQAEADQLVPAPEQDLLWQPYVPWEWRIVRVELESS